MNGTETKQVRPDNFIELLVSAGRSPEIPESEDVYGWLVGSWELEVLHYRAANLAGQGLRGEAHFSWALEGRAIQDVWIMPRFSERSRDSDHTNNMFGTTLRVWDAAAQAWATIVEKTRSSAVKGAPSCQVRPGCSFQVVSIRPSGNTCQVPLSTAGIPSTSKGCRTFSGSR